MSKIIGNDDPFNKAKLAEAAKRDQEMIALAKKQREKSDLQMQSSNRKKELERIQIELRSKETKLSLLERDILASKRLLASIRAELQKEESAVSSGANSLTSESEAKNSSQKALDKIKGEIETTRRQEMALESDEEKKKRVLEEEERKVKQLQDEIARLNAQVQNDKRVLVDLDRKETENRNLEVRLKQELAKTESEVKISEQDSLTTKKQTEVRRKKIEELKTKLLGQERLDAKVATEFKTISADIAKLKNDVSVKEREMADLTFKMNQIK
jgi:chromosome segregation protein